MGGLEEDGGWDGGRRGTTITLKETCAGDNINPVVHTGWRKGKRERAREEHVGCMEREIELRTGTISKSRMQKWAERHYAPALARALGTAP